MSEPSGKRIVSKGRYVVTQGVRTSLSVSGTGLLLSALLCGALATFVLLDMVCLYAASLAGTGSLATMHSHALLVLGLAGATAVLGKAGMVTFERVEAIDAGVPLTRANTADLPAIDSLVRASEEPSVQQQEMLLRPISPTDATPQEQLLRPS